MERRRALRERHGPGRHGGRRRRPGGRRPPRAGGHQLLERHEHPLPQPGGPGVRRRVGTLRPTQRHLPAALVGRRPRRLRPRRRPRPGDRERPHLPPGGRGGEARRELSSAQPGAGRRGRPLRRRHRARRSWARGGGIEPRPGVGGRGRRRRPGPGDLERRRAADAAAQRVPGRRRLAADRRPGRAAGGGDGGRRWVGHRVRGGSYVSESDDRFHFGLGGGLGEQAPMSLRLVAPDGRVTVLADPPADRVLVFPE